MNDDRWQSKNSWAEDSEGVCGGGIRDIWEGKQMQKLREEGFFEDKRTVALHFSTDGVQLFSNSTQEVWPFLTLNLNLPPEDRYFPHY
jgi:hypothetical protein